MIYRFARDLNRILCLQMPELETQNPVQVPSKAIKRLLWLSLKKIVYRQSLIEFFKVDLDSWSHKDVQNTLSETYLSALCSLLLNIKAHSIHMDILTQHRGKYY